MATGFGGRKKGAVNKVSATVKDNILAVFNRLDGTAGMARWAMENQTEFYKLYGRLIPAETKISGDAENPVLLFAGQLDEASVTKIAQGFLKTK